MTTERHQKNVTDLAESSELELLHEENSRLREANNEAFAYIRSKIDGLLSVIGTRTLKPEELDNYSLIEFDPISTAAYMIVNYILPLITLCYYIYYVFDTYYRGQGEHGPHAERDPF